MLLTVIMTMHENKLLELANGIKNSLYIIMLYFQWDHIGVYII